MADEVRKESNAVAAMSCHWGVITALLGGTPAMRKAAREFLPQWPNEERDSYEARLKVATLFPAFKRTIEVLAGKPFSKPLTIGDDVPAKLKTWTEDIDLQGRNLHSFSASLCEHALSYGLSGILVDYPRVENVVTVADEVASGVRPYWVHIKASQILGWRTARQNGKEVFTQLRLLECVTEDDGEFGEKEIEQVRVYYPGRWEVWRETNKSKKEWTLHEQGTTTLQKIPFVPVYGNRTGFMTAVPPLLEMAFMNVKHWQSQSDQDCLMHVARVPILFATMLGEAQITVGANSAIKAESPEADLKYVEHTGAAIEAGRLSLLDLEDQMRQAGAELLVIKPGNITEAQTLADNEQGMCALQRIVVDLQDSIAAAMQLSAEWVGERDGGHVAIYQDYGSATLADASATLLKDLSGIGGLSKQTVFEELQRRGSIRPELKWEDELARMELEGPPLGSMGSADGERQ